MGNDLAFAFGRNWQDFLRTFDAERVRIAEASLTEFLGMRDLEGKSFLDIGCGSGLFSYAAFSLEADRIVSFDVDPQSVACCRSLHERAGGPANWTVLEGSVLDGNFMAGLGTFDVVYSWGVLHHTGSMWRAVEKAASLVNPGGYCYIALYNKILGRNGSASWIHGFWLAVKRFYNAHPLVAKSMMLPPAMAAYLAMVVAKGENPIRHVREYKSHRGMSWKTDAIDWLGGYPYEFATVEEVFRFIKTTFPEFNLVNLKVTGGRGLNWYLFRRESSEQEGSR